MIKTYTYKYFKLFFIIFLFAFCTINLSAENNQNINDIESTIRNYNNGIIYASKTDTTEHMKAYANEKIVLKFHLWLKSWHDSNLFMDAKIINIDFKNIKLQDENNAVVDTEEEWIYRYIDIKTKKEVLPVTDIEYSVRYKLSREKSGWIIQKIDILSEKKHKK